MDAEVVVDIHQLVQFLVRQLVTHLGVDKSKITPITLPTA
jgi:hypothetical protein